MLLGVVVDRLTPRGECACSWRRGSRCGGERVCFQPHQSMRPQLPILHAQCTLAPPISQIDALNRERKVQQMTAGMELRRLEDEWANAVRKNLEISMACEKMEAEIRMLRAQLPQEEEPQQQEREQQQDEGGKENGQQQEGDEGEQQEGEDEKQREEGGEGRQGQQRHQVVERKDDGAGEKEEEGKEAGEDDEQQPQQDGQQQMDGVVEEQGQQQQDGRDGDGGGDLANGQHDEAEPMES